MKSATCLKFAMGVLCALMGLAFIPAHASAHTRIEVGPYLLVISWRNEPPLVNEHNAVLIEITEDGTPVEDIEGTLSAEILYGGKSFIGNVESTETPGVYAVEIIPTIRGQYTLRLTGSIGDTQLDEKIEPEEIQPASVLSFPEDPPDTRLMQQSIVELQAMLNTWMIVASVSAVVAIVALATAAYSLFRKPMR